MSAQPPTTAEKRTSLEVAEGPTAAQNRTSPNFACGPIGNILHGIVIKAFVITKIVLFGTS